MSIFGDQLKHHISALNLKTMDLAVYVSAFLLAMSLFILALKIFIICVLLLALGYILKNPKKIRKQIQRIDTE